MERYKKFFALWLLNSVLLFVFANFLPDNYTLGNSFFSPLQAAVVTGFVWNLVLWYTGPFFNDLELELKEPMHLMVAYLAVNFAVLWVLARLAVISGLGIGSWLHVLGLAIVANVVQYYTWQSMEKK